MSRICGVGIRFVLGLHGMSRHNVVQKLSKLCNNLNERVDERCWNCRKSLATCLISYEGMYFYNFQLFNDSSRGWIIEYQVDCSDLYFNDVQVEDVYINKSNILQLTEKVSKLLGYFDRSLLPFTYVES